MNSRKFKIASVLSLVSFFLVIDILIFYFFTSLVLSSGSEVMRAKSIELGEYLPFATKTKIVKKKDSVAFSGTKPVIDSAAALYPVSSAFTYSLYEESDVKFTGKNFADDSKLQMNNTRSCYQRIVDGTTDIGLLAKPSDEQKEYAKSKGVELILNPIGYEAFVFLVNKNNPIDSLTVDQVKGIYNGTYTNWKQLGGYDKEILPLQRNKGSGSQTTFLSFMGEEKTVSRTLNRFASPIGFSFRYYVEGVVQNGDVKMISLNGVYPDREHIQSKEYPLTSQFYAVTSSKNDNPNVPIFLDWMKGERAQSIIDGSGYVSAF